MKRRIAWRGPARLVMACGACNVVVTGSHDCPMCGAPLLRVVATPTSRFCAEIDLPLPGT